MVVVGVRCHRSPEEVMEKRACHLVSMEISSYKALEEFLRNFCVWGGGADYDVGGLVGLLGACIDNLRLHANDGDLEDLADHFTLEQTEFLLKLCGLLGNQDI